MKVAGPGRTFCREQARDDSLILIELIM
jgi:hypothetical protein